MLAHQHHNALGDDAPMDIDASSDASAASPPTGAFGVARTDLQRAVFMSDVAGARRILMQAVEQSLFEGVRDGARLEEVSSIGQTALHRAAASGNSTMVRLLLDFGANIEAPTRKSAATPLVLAAQDGHCEVVRLLLSRGARIAAATSGDGSTALHMAANGGHYEVLKQLLDAGQRNAATKEEIQKVLREGELGPAYFAAASGHADCLQLLIDRGAAVDNSSSQGWAPAHAAAHFNHIKCLELLLERGACPDTVNKHSQTTPLGEAARQGNTLAAQLLVDAGARVTAVAKKGQSVLHLACLEHGTPEMCELLLGYGADLSAKNAQGLTPAQLVPAERKQLLARTVTPPLSLMLTSLRFVNSNRSLFPSRQALMGTLPEELLERMFPLCTQCP